MRVSGPCGGDGAAGPPDRVRGGRVLVLAGTREARIVLAHCGALDVEASLAGATAASDPPGRVRIGGFGGEAGFRAALPAYAAVLDATHPFAARISERTAKVCAETGTPYLRLTRPAWEVAPDWHRHPDLAACAAELPAGARILLATGPGGLAPFRGRGLTLFCRRIDPAPPEDGVTWLVGRPGDAKAETGLLRAHAITHLVAKNSGGPGRGKLDAADALGLAVHIIDRPPRAPGEETYDIDAALAFLAAHADHRLRR